jgi:hypothetical protein
MGRPRKEINWTALDKLCHIQCTLSEIAGYHECSEDTIERAIKREKGVTFAEYYKTKSMGGKISLRRKQFQVAIDGDKGMLIWLGKQYLGQKERAEHEALNSDVIRRQLALIDSSMEGPPEMKNIEVQVLDPKKDGGNGRERKADGQGSEDQEA